MKKIRLKAKHLLAMMFFSLMNFAAMAQTSEAQDELEALKDDTLAPLLTTITGVIVLVCIVIGAILFWLKNREAIKYLGWIAAGALILRVGYYVVKAIIGDGIGG